ncbi:unnamed protein product [Discosporangium mesarthrocarpum]
MLGVAARRTAGACRPALRATRRAMSTAEETKMTLNFNVPHESIYMAKTVEQVIVPGTAGEYGVTAGHSPVVAELKPGVLQVIHEPGQEAEKFFVSAGFALTHANSVTDVTAIEAVRVDELDEAAVKEAYETSKKDMDAASEGSREKAEAQIGVETSRAMGSAIGITLA